MYFGYSVAYAMDTFYKSKTNANIQICSNFTDPKNLQIPQKAKGLLTSFLNLSVESCRPSCESPTSKHISGLLKDGIFNKEKSGERLCVLQKA